MTLLNAHRSNFFINKPFSSAKGNKLPLITVPRFFALVKFYENDISILLLTTNT